jgi:hypothetical protein
MGSIIILLPVASVTALLTISEQYIRSSDDRLNKSNPPLLSYDKTLINQYVELVRSRFLYNNVMLADSLINQLTKLIGELQK